jgi:RHS repeat-associated protein
LVPQPDGGAVTNVYLPTGELTLTYGSRTYPVAYNYDYAGRMQYMTNWSNFANHTGGRTTTWKYDGYRGFLTNKMYDSGVVGPFYYYTPDGRLSTRVWARGIVTAYTYGFNDGVSGNDNDDLISVSYSDDPQNTNKVTFAYDRLGRQSTIIHNGITDNLTYNNANQLLGELFTGGTLGGISMTNGYDQYLRRSALGGLYANTPLAVNSYSYDYASRLSTVTDGGGRSANYTYVDKSPLVQNITFKRSTYPEMSTTKFYDYLNRLTSISSVPTGSPTTPISFTYDYNDANQRVRSTTADASYWRYQYDPLGQVTGGLKYWGDQTPVAGQQFNHAFDDIGNRTQSKTGGDATGGYQRVATYGANTLNQYTNRTIVNSNDVVGVAVATNSVTINGVAAYRKGEYFRGVVGTNNSGSPAWLGITTSSAGSNVTGNVFIPHSPEIFGYDADGNLTNDGRWAFTWDEENRLVQVQSLSSGPTPSLRRVTWEYDGKGRRIRQTTHNLSTGDTVTEDLKFMNDGWRTIAELNYADNTLLRSYVWGLDLSGTMDGAGGVGGLLIMNSVTANYKSFYAYDGNGNVAGLVRAEDGSVVANYEYGPFGEVIRATGPMGKLNPFRFSTKYQDDESDLLYYGYPYYNASLGRWDGRDPNGELGFNSLTKVESLSHDLELNQVLQTGLQSLRDRNRKAFLNWLHELGERERRGVEPYDELQAKNERRSDTIMQGMSNLSVFNQNDAIDRIDLRGLATISLEYPCLNAPFCVGYCDIIFETSHILPKHPVLLEVCLTESTIVLDTACDLCCKPLHKKASGGLLKCYGLYW